MKYLKTPLRYPGGKSRVAKDFIPRFPKEIGEFREPFLGGGSVALLFTQMYPDVPVWVNDKYVYLYNFWTHLQKDGKRLSEDLVKIKEEHSSEDKAKELFKDAKDRIHKEDTYTQAVLFWVLNKCSYSGLTENSSFSATASRQNFTTKGARNLQNISDLIQKWKITNLDYSEVMRQNGNNVFLFLDPPYKIGTYLYGSNAELHKNFKHEEFYEACALCKHDWFVTYNNDDDLKRLYSNFHQEEFKITYGMKHRPDNKLKKELLVANYDINATPLEVMYA
tara:strand:- start:109 stop:945 length:837 start_codon:yes stop_codon:yes gene_type:complete